VYNVFVAAPAPWRGDDSRRNLFRSSAFILHVRWRLRMFATLLLVTLCMMVYAFALALGEID